MQLFVYAELAQFPTICFLFFATLRVILGEH
jgi:hypothetical protein